MESLTQTEIDLVVAGVNVILYDNDPQLSLHLKLTDIEGDQGVIFMSGFHASRELD